MLELIRRQLRRGARNRLILTGILFVLSAWIAALWSIAGDVRRGGEAFWVPVVAGCLALIFLLFVVRAIVALARPTSHPAVRHFGSFRDLRSFLDKFHPDEATTLPQQAGKVFFGRSILAVRTFGGLDILPFSQIAWVYPKDTTLKVVHGLVPVGKIHSLCIAAFNGVWAVMPLEVEDDEARVAQLLAAVKEYAPWAKVGYDEEFARAFRLRRKVALAPIAQKRDELLSKERQLEKAS